MMTNRRGFTLIEVMVAVVVLSIGLLAVVKMSMMYMNSNTYNNQSAACTIYAQEKMEELLDLSAADTDLNVGTHSDASNPVRSTFNRFWTVTDDDPVPDMKRVEVRVTYPRGSQTRDVIVVAYKRS